MDYHSLLFPSPWTPPIIGLAMIQNASSYDTKDLKTAYTTSHTFRQCVSLVSGTELGIRRRRGGGLGVVQGLKIGCWLHPGAVPIAPVAPVPTQPATRHSMRINPHCRSATEALGWGQALHLTGSPVGRSDCQNRIARMMQFHLQHMGTLADRDTGTCKQHRKHAGEGTRPARGRTRAKD